MTDIDNETKINCDLQECNGESSSTKNNLANRMNLKANAFKEHVLTNQLFENVFRHVVSCVDETASKGGFRIRVSIGEIYFLKPPQLQYKKNIMAYVIDKLFDEGFGTITIESNDAIFEVIW